MTREVSNRLEIMRRVSGRYTEEWVKQPGPADIRQINLYREHYTTWAEMLELEREEVVLTLVMMIVRHFSKMVERKRVISDPVILMRLAKEIIAKNHNMCPQDLRLCFQMGIRGELSPVLDSFDSILILAWYNEYLMYKRADNRYVEKDKDTQIKGAPMPQYMIDAGEVALKKQNDKKIVIKHAQRYKTLEEYCEITGKDYEGYMKDLELKAQREYKNKGNNDVSEEVYLEWRERHELANVNAKE